MEKDIRSNNAENPLVSIIVPMYKVEKYLTRCLDSIASQTYKHIEVILIDDGSPDRCGEISDAFAETHAYARVIHQPNQGQAAARNNAVKTAAGSYIVFIDSDDYVESDCIEYLVSLLRENQADVAIGNARYIYEGHEPAPRSKEEKVIKMNAEEAIIRMNYNRGFGATPWAKIYKKELILAHPFPVGQIYEDLATLYKIFGDCSTVVLGNRRIYYWIQRDGSTMRMEFDERQMAAMDAVTEQLHYLEARYPGAVQSGKYRYTAKAVELVAVCFNSGGNRAVFRRLRELMNRYADEVLKDRHAKTSMKARILAVKLGYIPSKITFALHENAKRYRFN